MLDGSGRERYFRHKLYFCQGKQGEKQSSPCSGSSKALCQAKEWSGPDKAVKEIREHSGSDDFKKW